MSEGFTLVCPVRGVLAASRKAKNGLTPTEEYRRVEAINHLVKLGYPTANFVIEPVVARFGNAGRNSFRADLAVLDVPATSVDRSDSEELLAHAVLLGEIKRDNAKADAAKKTQVKPLLDFARRQDCAALYWDNVEQRVFWTTTVKGKKEIHEGPLALLPQYGQKILVRPLVPGTLLDAESLLDTYSRIDDILHTAAIDSEERYEIILKLLLSKIFDEHSSSNKKSRQLVFQDFEALGVTAPVATTRLNELLAEAVGYYENHLPKRVSKKFGLASTVLVECTRLLAPIRITSARREVIQTFYMKFAKDLYRWDLAQYFTPTTVTDFIVNALNPQFGEHIKDPACGSADFLVAAFHRGRSMGSNYADSIWGADNSVNAVQAAVLNMLFNGDGKTNIKKEDSLEAVEDYLNRYDIMVCNPPFGVRIVEKRKSVLQKFDLGRAWRMNSREEMAPTDTVLDSQETGILFAELCVKQAKANGRIAIILPNGYLGNRSATYVNFREWLLRHCKVASICSFPRFTFKTSGADVSASVLFLQKRKKPLRASWEDADYAFHVGMVENVGWSLGNKIAAPTYQRNPDDGSFLVDPTTGDRIIDADFDDLLVDMRTSIAAEAMPWMTEQCELPDASLEGWSVPISLVTDDGERTLDPKRYSRKYMTLVRAIQDQNHLRLTDIVDVLPEMVAVDPEIPLDLSDASNPPARVTKQKSATYGYIEIQDIGYGEFRTTPMKGWELPQRGKHFAQAGDLYIGAVWGSVSKWFIVDDVTKNAVVTNGCYRLRIKAGMEDQLVDLVAFLCSEGYSVQMRALARGSDGLAEVHETDLHNVLIPIIRKKSARAEISEYIDALKTGRSSLKAAVGLWLEKGSIDLPAVPKRSHHSALV